MRTRHARKLEVASALQAPTALAKLARALSVQAGGSRQRWRAHPAPSPHPVMRSASLGGRARYGCRSVPGNISVGTSRSAGPRALQPGGQRARVALLRAILASKLLGAARPAFPAQDGPAGVAGAARFAAERAKRRGSWHEAAADGAAAAFCPEGRSSSIPILIMPPVPTPRCALFPRTARLLSGLLQPARTHASQLALSLSA